MNNKFTGFKHSEETKAKQSRSRTGRKRKPHSDETKLKMSAASKGKPKSMEHIESMRKSRLGKKFPPHSEEWRKHQSDGIKIALSNKDFAERKTDEYRAHQSAKMKEVWARRKGESNVRVSEI